MAFLGDEPKHELIIERVPGGRRAALVAAVVAALIVGTLVWKPWDTATRAPEPSLPAVAALSSPTVVPTASPTPVLAPTPLADLPAPQIATFDPGPQLLEAPGGLGTIAFYPGEGPAVWCIYKTSAEATPFELAVMVIEPPLVSVGDSAATQDLSGVRWHIELETNTEDKLFESPWTPLSASKAQTINVKKGEFGFVKPITLDVPAVGSITVVRVSIVIDWLGAAKSVLATQSVVPSIYGVLGAPSSRAQPGGCSATI